MTEQTTQEAVAEIGRLFKETDARFKETDARLDQRFRETDDKLRRLESLFGAQWGRLMEALVQSNVLKLFQARGHQVHRLHQRSKVQRNGDTMEIDLIIKDSSEVIVGEVKSVLKIEDINAFLTDLAEFTNFFPLYQGNQIYGAVAGLEVPAAVARYAYRRGLFVLAITGEGMVTIQNDDKFRPHNFGVDASTER